MSETHYCRIPGCPGEYVEERRLHAVHHGAEVIVADHVPMRVCDFCGDTLLTAETVQQLEELMQHPPQPARLIPLYEYVDAHDRREADKAKAHAIAD